MPSYRLICPGLPGDPRVCGNPPAAGCKVCEACIDRVEARAEESIVYCSICDGQGHGQPGHGPCPLEETGWEEALRQEAYEASMGCWS